MRKKHFTKQVGVILSEETYDQLVEQTNREEVTISEWIREAVEIRLKNKSHKSINNGKEGGYDNVTNNL